MSRSGIAWTVWKAPWSGETASSAFLPWKLVVLCSAIPREPMPSVAASGEQIVTAFAGHDWPTITNLVLSEGIPAVALAAVVLLVARAARRAGARRAGLAVAVFGVAAAAMSLAELAMAAWLQYGPVTSGHAATAATLWGALQRTDGVKF